MNTMNLYVYENRSMSDDLSKPLMLENLNVDNVQIHIPKEIDGTDMGTWAWWFVYQNARREKFSVPMTLELTTNDDDEAEYVASVSLDYGYTGKHGTVAYALEAIMADGTGNVIGEWHTRTYKHDVIYTLQGNQAEYVETEADIISALINRVSELITSGAEIAEIAETIENAAATAQEVIDSIPSDYSALSEDVETLKADLGDCFSLSTGDLLESGTDYNDLTTVGSWRAGSNDLAFTMINCPTVLAHRITIIATSATNRLMQVVMTVDGNIYTRTKTGTGFTPWSHLSQDEGAVDVLNGLTRQDGYYYDTNGQQVSDSKFKCVENVPYDPAYKYTGTHKPAIYFMNANGDKVYYLSGSRTTANYVLPTVYGATKMHVAYNSQYFPNFTLIKEKKEQKWNGKTCAIYGDSIAKGNYANVGGVVQKVPAPYLELASQLLKMTLVSNHAIGGSAYCTASDASSTLWANQISNGSPTQNEADVIFVSAGTNDWGHDSPLGALGDTATTTFYGAVYKTLDAIKTANPNSVILVITPLYRGNGDAVTLYNNTNAVNCKMIDYINAINDVCKMLNIRCIDMSVAGIHPYYTPNDFYTDHLHPIQSGHTRMGLWVCSKLNELNPVK